MTAMKIRVFICVLFVVAMSYRNWNDVSGAFYRSDREIEIVHNLPDVKFRSEIILAVKDASAKFDLPEQLLMSMIKLESGFDPFAISDKGAIGLMQVKPGTARAMVEMFGIAESGYGLMDVRYNVIIGSAYIRYIINECRGRRIEPRYLWPVILFHYNSGKFVPGQVAVRSKYFVKFQESYRSLYPEGKGR